MLENNTRSRTCPECGASFSCSANQYCWCMEIPAVLAFDPSPTADACYCRPCLSKRVAAQLEHEIANRPHAEMLAKATLYRERSPTKQSLLANIDYHPESQQLSAWYHLKRGYCCGSGCENCPYPENENSAKWGQSGS